MAPDARRGFTLVELLTVLGIVALLVGILLPAVNAARRAGQQIACASNLRQIGVALAGYVARDRRYLPYGAIRVSTSF